MPLRLRVAIYRSDFESLSLFSRFPELKAHTLKAKDTLNGVDVQNFEAINEELFELSLSHILAEVNDHGAKGFAMLEKGAKLVESVAHQQNDASYSKTLMAEVHTLHKAFSDSDYERQKAALDNIKSSASDPLYSGLFATVTSSKSFSNINQLLLNTLEQKRRKAQSTAVQHPHTI